MYIYVYIYICMYPPGSCICVYVCIHQAVWEKVKVANVDKTVGKEPPRLPPPEQSIMTSSYIVFSGFLILIFYSLLSYWAGIWGGCKSEPDPELKVSCSGQSLRSNLIKNVILEWFISAQTSMPSVLPCWSSMIPSVRKATTWRNFQGTCSLGWVTKYFLEFWH